ncbi:helix-turn-helix transcriptional regulator [Erythrobacter sp. JK5]|nr:helix-turn-helix transcriptional regulator [Erythrobacter sp. JK5]
MPVFPNRIREHRLAKKLSQAELGQMVGVSDVAIGYWEVEKRDPRLSNLRALARALKVTTADLLSAPDNP